MIDELIGSGVHGFDLIMYMYVLNYALCNYYFVIYYRIIYRFISLCGLRSQRKYSALNL